MELTITGALWFLLIALGSGPGTNPRSRGAPGEINSVEGSVYVDGNLVRGRPETLSPLASGNKLDTAMGHLEILLNPGSFLRVGHNAEVQLISLAANRIEIVLVKGKFLFDIVDLNESSPSVSMGASVTNAFQPGIYEFDANRCRVEVYKGRARVRVGTDQVDVRGRNAANCSDGHLETERFDARRGDELYAWSARTAERDAEASYGAARASNKNPSKSGWYWDPVMNCWAFVPSAGTVSGPFGWAFASPRQLSRASIFLGPVFHYPAAANLSNLPHVLPLPPAGATIDIARAPRISRPDLRAPINMGPGVPSIPMAVPQ